MKVRELTAQLANGQSRVFTTTIGDLELVEGDGENQSVLEVRGHNPVQWDSVTQKAVGPALGIPARYLDDLPFDVQKYLFDHHVSQLREKAVTLYAEGPSLLGVFTGDKAKVIPLGRVAERIGNVFDGDDDVVNLRYDDQQVEIDVITDRKQIVVPEIDRLEHRPMNDVTRGGVRVQLWPGSTEFAPQIHAYYHRQWCANGAYHIIPGGQIRLRAQTVEDVLQEMENVFNNVYNNLLDEGLEEILKSAQVDITGDISQVVLHMSQEGQISPRLANRVIEGMPAALGVAADGTYIDRSAYGLAQIFTDLANSNRVKTGPRRALQAVGGLLQTAAETQLDRCGNCHRLNDHSHN